MTRPAAILGAVALAAALVGPVSAAPSNELSLVDETRYVFGQWTDPDGVPCLSDENYWERTWHSSQAFSGSLTASVYLCPTNPNAPVGATNVDIWAAFAIGNGNGSATLTLTYPDGAVVPARYNAVTGWTEVCVVRDTLLRMPGVYTMTFIASRTRSNFVHLDTDYAESVRGRYWWGCDPSWGQVKHG